MMAWRTYLEVIAIKSETEVETAEQLVDDALGLSGDVTRSQ